MLWQEKDVHQKAEATAVMMKVVEATPSQARMQAAEEAKKIVIGRTEKPPHINC